MRSLVLCLLAAIGMWSDARAGEVEDKTFRDVIVSYLRDHPPQYPEDLMDLHAEGVAKVVFSIDRDGKLLDAKITSGSGSATADQSVLDWITRLQPFPKIPADVSAPVRFSQEFVFVPPSVRSDVKIKWSVDAGAAAKEASFRDQVASHLQRHPRSYSEEMKVARGARRAVVALSIDRSGKLLNVEVTRRSTSQAVDKETLAWLKDVQPYPQIPADMEAPLKLTAEIEFGAPPKFTTRLWEDAKIKRAISGVCRGC